MSRQLEYNIVELKNSLPMQKIVSVAISHNKARSPGTLCSHIDTLTRVLKSIHAAKDFEAR